MNEQTKGFDPYEFEQIEVNGVSIFYKYLPWMNDCVHIRAIMRIGARHDPEGKEGLAHFFEHLPFDGCEGYPTFKEVSEFKRRILLGCFGAYTWYDETVYHCMTLPKNLQQVFQFLKQVLFHPILASTEVERERGVITREFWDHFGNKNLAQLRKVCYRDCFHNHRIGRGGRALGWIETIATITHEDIAAFHAKRYVKENIILVCVGSIDANRIRNATKDWEGALPTGERVPLVEPVREWPNPTVGSRSVSYQKDFYAQGGAIPENTGITITRVAPRIYTEGTSALFQCTFRHLLFEEIRGRLGATYSPRVFWNTYGDICHAGIEIQVKPDLAEQIKHLCGEIMGRLGSQADDYRALFGEMKDTALDQIRATDKNGSAIADDARDDLVLYHRVIPLAERKTECERVTYEEVCALAEQEFNPDRVHFCVVRP